MIKLRVGNQLIEIKGHVSTETKIKYLHETAHPNIPGKVFRFGKYFEDDLSFELVTTPDEYKNLYKQLLEAVDFKVLLQCGTNFCSRTVSVSQMPYPSKIRILKSEASFKATSKPYYSVNYATDPDFLNQSWNQSIIHHTIWR